MALSDELISKILVLQRIYDRHHYFIDRHDGMAEKMMNALVIITTIISAMAALKINSSGKFLIVILIVYVIFMLLFCVTLIILLRTIRPLSKKAIKYKDETLLIREHKKNVNASVLYHRGIISIIEAALEEECSPSELYLKKLNENYEKDLVSQIFILAQYNQYKRVYLERATLFMELTIVSGVILVIIIFISTTLRT